MSNYTCISYMKPDYAFLMQSVDHEICLESSVGKAHTPYI